MSDLHEKIARMGGSYKVWDNYEDPTYVPEHDDFRFADAVLAEVKKANEKAVEEYVEARGRLDLILAFPLEDDFEENRTIHARGVAARAALEELGMGGLLS
jgi:hypothetical protein